MGEHRHQILLTIGSAAVVLAAALATASGQQPGRLDPERAFALGDSNLDGKLSLEEFRELIMNGARRKNAAKKVRAGRASGTALPSAGREP